MADLESDPAAEGKSKAGFNRAMSCDEVADWLTKNKIPPDISSRFKRQNISGDTFIQLPLTKEDLSKKLECDLSVRVYTKLHSLISQARAAHESSKSNSAASRKGGRIKSVSTDPKGSKMNSVSQRRGSRNVPSPFSIKAPSEFNFSSNKPTHEKTLRKTKQQVHIRPEQYGGFLSACQAGDLDAVVNICLQLLQFEPEEGVKTKTEALEQAAKDDVSLIVHLLKQSGINLDERESEDGPTALYTACDSGHTTIVKVLVGAGASLDLQRDDARTALWVAAYEGHHEIVTVLTEAGAQVDLKGKEGSTALYIATQNGHYKAVAALLKAKADPNVQTKDGWSVLKTASAEGYLEVVKLLIEAGASLDVQDEDGWTALCVAAQNGHNDVMEALLKAKANVDIRSKDGSTALYIASNNEHLESVQLLIKNAALLDIPATEGRTALWTASFDGNVEIVQAIVDAGAALDLQEEDGWTALYAASNKGHDEVVAALLKSKADPNIPANNGSTPLWTASYAGQLKVVKTLLDDGAASNLQDEDGWTALYAAANNGHDEVVAALLKSKADLTIPDNDGSTPLWTASYEGELKVVETLLDAGAAPDLQDEEGRTAVYAAADQGHADVVAALLKAKADANIVTNDGRTAVWAASFEGFDSIVEQLIKAGATVDIQDELGSTALHVATQNGHKDIVEALVKANANVNVQAKNGATALSMALQSGHSHIVKILLEAKAGVNVQNEEVAPLFTACVSGNVENVKLLIEHGAHLDFQTNEGHTALFVASSEGHTSVVQALVDDGAALDLQDEDGWTALYAAAGDGHDEVVAALLKAKADPNIQAEDGSTALNAATSESHLKVIELLTEAGAIAGTQKMTFFTACKAGNVDAIIDICLQHMSSTSEEEGVKLKDKALKQAAEGDVSFLVHLLKESGINLDKRSENGGTALYAASNTGQMLIVKMLIQAGASLNLQRNNGWTALKTASFDGHLDTVKLLIDAGALVDVQDEEGWTALHVAAQNGHKAVVEVLLKAKASINLQTNEGLTSLHKAVQNDHLEVVSVFVQAGADLNLQTEDGRTALFMASIRGHVESAKLFIKHGAELDTQANTGRTALWVASFEGYTEIVEVLIGAGASVNIQDKKKSTALHVASQNGHDATTAALLKANADPNLKTKRGRTALHVASSNGHEVVVKQLIDAKATVNIQNENGLTALYEAARNGHHKVVAFLLNVNADINIKSNDGWTAIKSASLEGHLEVVKLLADAGALVNVQDKDGWTAMHVAAQNGHTAVGEILLKAKANCDIQNKNGETALYKASTNGHVNFVRLLVEHKAPLDVETGKGRTALWASSYDGYLEIVEILTNAGATVNTQDKLGSTALHVAAQNGHDKTVEVLLRAKADVNIQTKNETTALHLATRRSQGHEKVVEKLLEAKPNVNIRDQNGATALFIACSRGHSGIVKRLVDKGALVDIQTKDDRTPLWTASIEGHVDIVQLLLDAGAAVDKRNKKGSTALLVASQNGHDAVVAALLKANADPNIQTDNGRTALYMASTNGKVTTVELLINAGAMLNIKNKGGWSALYAAANSGYDGVVAALIKGKADVNITNNDGWTPLKTASLDGHLKTVQLLLDAGALVNIQDKDGWTALHVASQNGHKEVADALIKAKADVNIRTKTGWTALYKAAQNSHDEVAGILLRANADANIQANNGWTALKVAVREGHLKVVKVLVDRGASVNILDEDGWTPLYTASQKGLIEMARILLKAHADPNIKTKNGRTPLWTASYGGYIEIVRMLIEAGAQVDIQDNVFGSTALHTASQNGHKEVAQEILKAKADVNIKTKQRETALQIATQHDHKEIAALLREVQFGLLYMASPSVKHSKPRFALEIQVQPKDFTCKPGEKAELSIKVNMGSCIYQWYHNDQAVYDTDSGYKGSNEDVLCVTNCLSKHIGPYKCTVTDRKTRSSVTSKEAHLIISGKPIGQDECRLLGGILQRMEVDFSAYGIEIKKLLNGTIQLSYEEMQFIMKGNSSTQILSERLEMELVSKLDEERLYQEAMAKGYKISLSYTKILAMGPGQVGKSTFLYRLMGLMKGNIQTAPSDTQPGSSTGIAELRQACIKYTRMTGAVTNNDWQVFNEKTEVRSQLDGLIQLLSKQIQEQKLKDEPSTSKPKAVPIQAKAAVVPKKAAVEEGRTQPKKTVTEAPKPKSEPQVTQGLKKKKKTPSEALTESPAATKPVLIPPRQNIARVIQDFEKLQEECMHSMSSEKVSFDMLLNVADIGGQPAFLEMLPSLTIGPALYLVFMKLLEGLKAQYPAAFKCKDTHETKLFHDYMYTSEEVIFTALSSIACFGNSNEEVERYVANRGDKKTTTSLALLVGTHADQITEPGKLDEIDDELKEHLEETEFYTEGLIHSKKFLRVNNFSSGDEEIQEHRKLLEDILTTKFRQYDIPARWLMLSICLKILAQNEGTHEVSFDDCVEIGKHFQMSEEVVKVALQFLHKYIGLVMYFPDHDNLKNVVICDPQAVFTSISELIFKIYDPSNLQVIEAQRDRFVQTGCFSPQDVKEPKDRKPQDSKVLSIGTLIDLLVHLNIAAEVPSSQDKEKSFTDDGSIVMTDTQQPTHTTSSPPKRKEYFFPAVLRSADIAKELQRKLKQTKYGEKLPEPLCIRFKTGYMPLGFVCALSAKLLAEEKFHLIFKEGADSTYKNLLKFRYNGEFDILMISGPKYCEIRVTRHSGETDFWSKECCPQIKKTISEAADSVIRSMKHGSLYKLSKGYELAFKCPEHKEAKIEIGHEPLARIVYNPSSQIPKKIQCVKRSCDTSSPLTPEIKMWFGEKLPDVALKVTILKCGNKLKVTATGSNPLTFQWSKDEEPLSDCTSYSGSTTDELVIEGTDSELEGTYCCCVTDRQKMTKEKTIKFDPFAMILETKGLKESEIKKLIHTQYKSMEDLEELAELDEASIKEIDLKGPEIKRVRKFLNKEFGSGKQCDMRQGDDAYLGNKSETKPYTLELNQQSEKQPSSSGGLEELKRSLHVALTEVRAHWYQLGIQLEIKHSTLETIRTSERAAVGRLEEVVHEFLTLKHTSPKEVVIKALCSTPIKKKYLVENVEELSFSDYCHTPQSQEVCRHARRLKKVLNTIWEIHAHWKTLAGQLIDVGTCEAIQENHGNVGDRFAALLNMHLEGGEDQGLEELLNALRSNIVDRNDVAKLLEEALEKDDDIW